MHALVLTWLLLSQKPAAPDAEHRAIFEELVEIDTSTAGVGAAPAARAIAIRLRAAGYAAADVELIGPTATCQNLVATLRGRDAQATPVLLLAHLDVVPARREDWAFDPFELREQDGWFLGRGTLDNKAGASILVANLVRWKREGYVPARDIVTVLTCDEETSAEGGMRWLLAERPRLAQADFALNTDAGGVERRANGGLLFDLQAAEKAYLTFTLTARNEGGHSSVPRPDNAIYALATALGRLAAFRFPIQYNDVSRTAFARAAAIEAEPLAGSLRAAGRGETTGPAIERLTAIPHVDTSLRTTCVATMIQGGHAENALPQSASATVNCRVFPGVPADEVSRLLAMAIADPSIAVATTYPMTPSPASPLRPDLMSRLEDVVHRFWPDAVILPAMSAGATDGLYLRNAAVPVYGVSGIEIAPEHDRAHGLDERVPVASLYTAREFWYALVPTLVGR